MLGFGVIAISLLMVIACIVVVTRSWSGRSGGHTAASLPTPPSFRIRAGGFDELATSILGPGTTVPEVEQGDGRVAPLTEVTLLRAGRDSSNPSSGATHDRKGRRAEAMRDAAFIALPSELLATAAGAETVHDVLAMDSTVLRSLHQLSGEQVSGLADLRDLQDSRHYDLLSFKVRGGAGEQAVADHFTEAGHEVTWPAGGATEFGPSNNPGWDLAIDGHEVNVKVVSDASSAIAEHFARYPDVPLVLNENAANIPDDALIFDGETPLDPGQLVGDHLVILDESLSLSGLEHAQASVADAAGDPLTDGLADQIPIGLCQGSWTGPRVDHAATGAAVR